MAHPIAVTDTSFADDVLNSDLPVMVDFWAEWCGPCKMIAPIVEDLAEDYSGKMVFAKVDVDSNPETAMKYGVRGIPTLLLFSGGSPVDQVVGAVAKGELVKRIDKVLS
ncbi:MAG: thioredoxin [SAR202 cluster bacterium]|nr:thioredoxin [SAR202 cluster bacterium]